MLAGAQPGSALARIEGLTKTYVQRGMLNHRRALVTALAGIDMDIPAGGVLGLVGQSGSGKSTLARCLTCLEEPSSGHIWWDGRDLRALRREELPAVRRQIQLIFQEAATALNPRFTALEIVAEPFAILGVPRDQRQESAQTLIAQVGLAPELARRRPHQLSGGQRQRLAIARALTIKPRLLVLDEALVGLDLAVAKQILELLATLRQEHGLTYLFISHDLGLVGSVADKVAVMYQGQIVEQGCTAEVLDSPRHEHTQALLRALPRRVRMA